MTPGERREYRLARYARFPDLRARERQEYYARGRKHALNNYRRWALDESRLIMTAGVADQILSATLGRTVSSIQVRRSKILAGEVNP